MRVVVLGSNDNEDDECGDGTNKYSLRLYPEASIYRALKSPTKDTYLCVIRNDYLFTVLKDLHLE